MPYYFVFKANPNFWVKIQLSNQCVSCFTVSRVWRPHSVILPHTALSYLLLTFVTSWCSRLAWLPNLSLPLLPCSHPLSSSPECLSVTLLSPWPNHALWCTRLYPSHQCENPRKSSSSEVSWKRSNKLILSRFSRSLSVKRFKVTNMHCWHILSRILQNNLVVQGSQLLNYMMRAFPPFGWFCSEFVFCLETREDFWSTLSVWVWNPRLLFSVIMSLFVLISLCLVLNCSIWWMAS